MNSKSLNAAVSDNSIEKEIQDKGLTAPRVTPALIEALIEGEYYFTAGHGTWAAREVIFRDHVDTLNLLTFCVLVLRNGFTVTGESACVSPENFNPETGRKIARQHAIDKIWMLEGYLLKQRLHESV